MALDFQSQYCFYAASPRRIVELYFVLFLFYLKTL